MKISNARSAALTLAFLCSSRGSAAELEWQPPPMNRLVQNSLVILRHNPRGVEYQLRAGYQRRLYDHENRALRDNFAFVGLAPKLNPAYVKVGPSVELQPLSIFNLRLTAEYLYYFSTFGYLQSFPSPHRVYSDTALAAGTAAKANYRTTGMHYMVEPMAQIKFGKIALRNRFSLERWSMSLRAGDSVFYDATLDTLVPANGWTIANDFDALYLTGTGLVLGLRHSSVRAIYQSGDFQAGEVERNDNGHHRLGPLVAYTFFESDYTKFNKPTIVLVTGWYLGHRFRTGADVSRAVPYVVLGFAFQSDFLD